MNIDIIKILLAWAIPIIVVLFLVIVILSNSGRKKRSIQQRTQYKSHPQYKAYPQHEPFQGTFKKGSQPVQKCEYEYQLRSGLFTNNELSFYKVLLPIATKKGYVVFGKVKIEDLIQVKKGAPNYQAARNKISSKHVDFVLCDKATVKPLLVIELDDRTHDRPDRQERDTFVDSAMGSAGLPILHTRTTDNLSENITNAMK